MAYKELFILNKYRGASYQVTFYKEGTKVKKTLKPSKPHLYNGGEESLFKVDLDKYDRVIINVDGFKSLPIYLNEFTPDLYFIKPKKDEEYLNVLYYLHKVKKTGKIETLSYRSKKLSFRKYYLKAYVYSLTEDKNKPYSLIIGYDGQNLFSKNGVGKYAKGDPYGSWQLDLVLNKVQKITHKNYLVVSVDNATYYREKELMVEPSFGKINKEVADNSIHYHGRLTSLNDFILNDILEDVKKKYKIDFDDVGIIGSSMGGIASFYTALVHNDLFKYAIPLSPALLFFDPKDYEKIYKEPLPKMYIGGGYRDELEQNLMDYVNKYIPHLDKHYSKENYRYQFVKPYNHNEIAWRYFLTDAFTYLLKK